LITPTISKRVGIFAAIFLAGMFSIHVAIAFIVRHQIAEARPDFLIYYTEARIFHSGDLNQAYDEAGEGRLQQQIAGPNWTPSQVKPYMHPPFEILLFAPLGALSFLSAYTIWSIFNLVLLIVCVLLLRNTFPEFGGLNGPLWFLVLFSFFPTFLTILEGQDTILLLLAYICSFRALRRNAELSAGAWLGLGLVRPHLILPFVFIMALRRKWRFAAGFALAVIAATVLSALTMGWQGALAYPKYIWTLEHTRSGLVIPPQYIPNVRGLLDYFAGNLLVPKILLALNVIFTVALVIWVRNRWASIKEKFDWSADLAFGLATVVASLVSYHEFIYDFSILVLPIIVALNAATQQPRLTQVSRLWCVFPILLLFLSPLYVLLWYRWGLVNLMALVELAFAFGISRALSTDSHASLEAFNQ
jgi:hypothetical protein